MARESTVDGQEAVQLSEDEDTIEFEIEVVSTSESSFSSRASSRAPDEDRKQSLDQTDEIKPLELAQPSCVEIVNGVVLEQELAAPQPPPPQPPPSPPPPTTTPTTSEPTNEQQSHEGDRLSSVAPKIPIEVHERDLPHQAEAGSEQQVATELTPESTDETTDQIEGEPDARQADTPIISEHDLREAPPSTETNMSLEQSIECEVAGPSNEPEDATDLRNVDLEVSGVDEATSESEDGSEPSNEQTMHQNDRALIVESASDRPFEKISGEADLTVLTVIEADDVDEAESSQRRRQLRKSSDGFPSADDNHQGVDGPSADHALYEPADSMRPAPAESATVKENRTEIDRHDDELAAGHEAGEECSPDGAISIQIEGIPSLVEVHSGKLEHDDDSSPNSWSGLTSGQPAIPENKDRNGLQVAPGGEVTPPGEYPNELGIVDQQPMASPGQLSSSSSLSNFLGLHDASATVDDDDLEREFDEEPEFQCRNVQVKRNRNPRDEYELGDELGRGKFGTVFRCTEKSSGLGLAAKFMHIRRREDRDDVEREVGIMSELQHKRLLQLYDAFDDGLSEMCLIMELVEGGELFERIVDDDFDLTEKKAAIFMRQICEGVEYMHGKQIVHLDMKPENILCLSRTGNRIKLIDFGLARRLDPNKPIRVLFGTPDFAAPEVLAYETVTLETDMWSVGVICYVLLSGLSPFMGDSDMETMANVMRATFDFNDQAFEAISDLAKDFISKLLVREPGKRLTPAECLRHAWLERGGRPLEAHIRERRKSSLGILLEGHHRLALEQVAAAAAAAPMLTEEGGPTTPPALPMGFNWSGHFRPRPSIGAESCASVSSHQSLDKRRLKKYVVRRKWHKTVHAIMALSRMGANLKLASVNETAV